MRPHTFMAESAGLKIVVQYGLSLIRIRGVKSTGEIQSAAQGKESGRNVWVYGAMGVKAALLFAVVCGLCKITRNIRAALKIKGFFGKNFNYLLTFFVDFC